MTKISNKEERCQHIKKLIDNGKGVCESCREVGISEKTYYRWSRELNQRAK